MNRTLLNAQDDLHPNFYVIGVYDPEARTIHEYAVYGRNIRMAIIITANILCVWDELIVSARLH